jgi:integrase
MASFILQKNNAIYLYHWYGSSTPIKISTNLKIDPSKWNKNKQRALKDDISYKGAFINKELIRYENALYRALEYFKFNGGFSGSNVNQKVREFISNGEYTKPKKSPEYFLPFYTELYEDYKKRKVNNFKGYGTTLNHLKTFFGNSKPTFKDIDTNFYVKYNNYLLKLGLAKNTISGHWKFIKAVMSEAKFRKLHTNSDYDMFKRPKEDTDKVFLTEKEINSIYNLKLTGRLDKARDYFIVGCLTGLRFSDWDKLEKSIIKDGIASIRSQKTNELSMIPIHKKVLAILNKYDEGKLPKKPSNQKVNEYIKEIAELAGINETVESRITKGGKQVITKDPKYSLISTHTARRSFATMLVLKGESPYLIMQITGHKSLASFEKYVRINELQASIKLKNINFFK